MPGKEIAIIGKELHQEAEKLAQGYVDEFALALIWQAKLLAFQRKDNIVLTNHVEEALEIIRKGRKQGSWSVIRPLLGAAFFGTSVRGLISELAELKSATFIVIYILLGFTGFLLMLPELRRY